MHQLCNGILSRYGFISVTVLMLISLYILSGLTTKIASDNILVMLKNIL